MCIWELTKEVVRPIAKGWEREEASTVRTNGFLGEQTGNKKICDNICLCRSE